MPTTREEQAATELGTTEITPGVARALVAACAVMLVTVPLLQWVSELRAYSAKERNTPWPSATEILTAPSVALHGWSQAEGNIGQKTLAANAELLSEIRRFETSLEDDSIVNSTLLGPTRNWLARLAGWGTEEAWIGRDGWLFYRPDLDYSIGPPFLDPDVLQRRQRAGLEFSARRHPDPRPAILDFARQLELRNIQLVVVPTPTKAMVHPDRFGGQNDSKPLHNRSWPQLLETLKAANITVFDPLPVLRDRRRRDFLLLLRRLRERRRRFPPLSASRRDVPPSQLLRRLRRRRLLRLLLRLPLRFLVLRFLLLRRRPPAKLRALVCGTGEGMLYMRYKKNI